MPLSEDWLKGGVQKRYFKFSKQAHAVIKDFITFRVFEVKYLSQSPFSSS